MQNFAKFANFADPNPHRANRGAHRDGDAGRRGGRRGDPRARAGRSPPAELDGPAEPLLRGQGCK